MKRRQFIIHSAVATSAMGMSSWLPAETGSAPVVRVNGESPHGMTLKAIDALGGMKSFVSRQDIVMIKPNIGWNRTVEQAACTNPDVVRALVELALDAGAKRVIVMDHTCHQAVDTYRRSGIEKAAAAAGAEVRHVDDNRLVIHDFSGENVSRWPVYRDFLEVDTFINVPILKHHGSAEMTAGMKNLYGILGGRRGKLHRNMGASIADLARGFKTDLTVVDAFRVLMRNGPVGGRLSDVEMKKAVLASSSIMEVDVIAAGIFGRDPGSIPFLREGAERKLGSLNPEKINLKTMTA